jgi:hypothetical protein
MDKLRTKGTAEAVPHPLSMEPSSLPLSSRAQPRDLQFRGPFLEMFFDRSEVERSAVLPRFEV